MGDAGGALLPLLHSGTLFHSHSPSSLEDVARTPLGGGGGFPWGLEAVRKHPESLANCGGWAARALPSGPLGPTGFGSTHGHPPEETFLNGRDLLGSGAPISVLKSQPG